MFGIAVSLLLVSTGEAHVPLVYVYDLREFWDVAKPVTLKTMGGLDPAEIVGPKCSAGLAQEYATHMYSLPMILLWRILRSSRRTMDPSKADLFFVPMWPRQKSQKMWEDRCGRPVNLEIANRLPYLTEETAHRHFFAVGKGHVKVGGHCDSWWKHPTGLLKRAMRFAYSSDYGTAELLGQERYGPFTLDDPQIAESIAVDIFRDDVPYPHLVSVPYPSSIHMAAATKERNDWSRDPTKHSKVLASFVGGAHTKSTFAAPRKRIKDDCNRAPDEVCTYINYKDGVFSCGLAEYTMNSTFCFQPGGDSPYRKSFYDAVMTGCIPVVFAEYNARVSPWHFWAGHRQNAMVVVNATRYLRGEFDVLRYLQNIPQTQIIKMQNTITHQAHRLQYALNDASPDDAVDIILRGAWHMARARDRVRR